MHLRHFLEVAVRQKSITLRLPEDEYRAFTTICNERGYSKTGKIREFIRSLVADEISEAASSAGEWERARERLRGGRPRTGSEGTRKRVPRPVAEERPKIRPLDEASDESWKL